MTQSSTGTMPARLDVATLRDWLASPDAPRVQVRLVAGGLVLGGVLINVLVPNMKWLAAAVRGSLAVAALTNSCIMESLLSKLLYNQDASCDLPAVLQKLSATGWG